MEKNTVYLVVPCYNEEAVLPETAKRLQEKLRGMMKAGRAAADSWRPASLWQHWVSVRRHKNKTACGG